MLFIPNLPGVPSLTGYTDNIFPLILSDAIAAINNILDPPQWGIYIDGEPVITPASFSSQQAGSTFSALSSIAALIGIPNVVPVTGSTVEFDYAADSPISNYPQEQGAFQSYNKVQLPFEIKLKIGCSGDEAERQAFQSTLAALLISTALVDIVTPETVYSSCNCKHVDFRRSARNGVTLIVADVWFEQVRVISATEFSNTKSPAAAEPQSLGNVQPQTPNGAVTQQYQSNLNLFGGAF
jgi:hypothetical protein